MNQQRAWQLLAYAKICFDHSTSPFAHLHLTKMNVTAMEAMELSELIAQVIKDHLVLSTGLTHGLLQQAEETFKETQE